jgi:hypothetical protein
MTTPADRPTDPDPPDPFAGLIRELRDLGFEEAFTEPDTTDTVYAATDSRVAVTVVNHTRPPCVRVVGGRDSACEWVLTWTANVAHPTQLICLYAALNDDPTAAIEAAAASIGVQAPTGRTAPSPTVG